MGLNTTFDKANTEYGDGSDLVSQTWTVGHVVGAPDQFLAVNGEFGNFSLKFDDTQSFWKKAIKDGVVPADGYTRNDNRMRLDYVTIVHVPPVQKGLDGAIKRLSSYEQYLAAVDVARTKYREKMALAGPSVDYS